MNKRLVFYITTFLFVFNRTYGLIKITNKIDAFYGN